LNVTNLECTIGIHLFSCEVCTGTLFKDYTKQEEAICGFKAGYVGQY